LISIAIIGGQLLGLLGVAAAGGGGLDIGSIIGSIVGGESVAVFSWRSGCAATIREEEWAERGSCKKRERVR
jgi:hypothetical protein